MKNITKELLEEKFGDNVYEANEYVKTLLPKYPQTIRKPILIKNHTSKDLKEYTILLENYENDLLKYKEEKEIYYKEYRELNSIIEEYIKEITGFYNIVPKDKQDKVWSKAYQDGHSDGNTEIYNKLQSLIELFED
jgi:hypothetical protein